MTAKPARKKLPGYLIERAGKMFRIAGSFGNVHVYLGNQCLAFGIMTKNDAENWIWSHFPERQSAA